MCLPCLGAKRLDDAMPGERLAGNMRHVLEPFLARTDILVCLLPLTPETRGILEGLRKVYNARRLLEELGQGGGG